VKRVLSQTQESTGLFGKLYEQQQAEALRVAGPT
jgi:hypothetical protein